MSTKSKKVPMRTLMAYLDGELSPEREAKVRAMLATHPEWQKQFQELQEVVGATEQLRIRVDPSIWDHYWEEIDARLPRRFGWVVALAGSLILMSWGFFKALAYAENDFVTYGILLIAIGMITLFVTVVRGRFLEMPKDRYLRIKR